MTEPIFLDSRNGYDRIKREERDEIERYCERYKTFLNQCKTERLCVAQCEKLARENGFVLCGEAKALRPGDKVYYVNKNKNIFLAVIGESSLAAGANFSVAHADSPRLDVKPRPAYEEGELAYFKTHLYGWVRKHQWLALPLAMHGVVYLGDGSCVTVNLGEAPGDPQFIINDLLPHLGREQNKKPLAAAIPNDAMNVVVGSCPVDGGAEGSRIKAHALRLLHEKYGIAEEDLISAELEMVPAGYARDIGFDRSLIAAYKHDDLSCGYAQLAAILELERPQRTAVCVLTDKEEVNSDGVSGMKSAAFDRFMKTLCRAQGVELEECYARSLCLSADVTAAYDPNFKEVYEPKSCAYVNFGIALSKYTGHDGDKSDASDASAEVVSRVRTLFNRAGVVWQMCEMGDPEAGGGGTIAKFMANRNIDTIDAGVPVLSMHAPFETVSKLDCYMTYRAIKTIYQDNNNECYQ